MVLHSVWLKIFLLNTHSNMPLKGEDHRHAHKEEGREGLGPANDSGGAQI